MGKYTNKGKTYGVYYVDPEGAAKKIVDAWKEVVTRYIDQMADNYEEGLTEFTADEEKIAAAKEKLADYYERIAPKLHEKYPKIMAEEKRVYKRERARAIAQVVGGRLIAPAM